MSDFMQKLAEAMDKERLSEFIAILQKHPEAVRLFRGYNTLLHTASGAGLVQFVTALVNHGADVNASRLNMPEGPLYNAVVGGHHEIVLFLLSRGATSDHELDCPTYGKSKRNYSLSSACRNGRFDIVKLLVEHGADVNATYAGQNALSNAQPYPEIVAYLRSKGAKTPAELGYADPANSQPSKKGRKR